MKSKDELGELANTFDEMLARLQAAFERQRQFVADASHELRTPLTIVNLESSRALASKRSAEEYQRVLGIIRSENEFMSHLVNDLLTLARLDSGQMAMEKTPLDLSDIALEALERLAPLAERKNVRLETGDLPEVILPGDRQYLLQMMSNLVENGIKYTGGESPFVRVETGAQGDSAWVRVSDSGAGIPPEHVPHLFDRFYRVDKVRGREQDEAPSGNGLGLSIVQWIALAHGGEVHVESTRGRERPLKYGLPWIDFGVSKFYLLTFLGSLVSFQKTGAETLTPMRGQAVSLAGLIILSNSVFCQQNVQIRQKNL